MNLNTINEIASELFLALKNQETIQPLSEKYEEININDAYQISRKFLSLREDQRRKGYWKKNRRYKLSCARDAWS
jgi:2-keto-4-pentenoate hydratase